MSLLSKIFKRSKPEESKGVLTPIQEFIFASIENLEGVGVYNVHVVNAIIRYIGNCFARLPYKEYEYRANNDPKEILNSNEYNLVFVRPNSYMTGIQLAQYINMFYQLDGNSYAHVLPGVGGRPINIVPLLSQHVEVMAGNGRPIDHFIYNDPSGRIDTYPLEEMFYMRTVNPESLTHGKSIISAARSVIKLQQSGEQWNQSMLNNKGNPEGVWKSDAVLTDKQRDELLRQVMQAVGDYKTKGYPLVTGAGLDWKQLSYSPQDMEWLQTDKQAIRKVAMVLHFPAELIGDGETSTYNNVHEAKTSLYNDTILPLADDYTAVWNNFMFPKGNRYFKVDKSEVEVLQKTLKEKADALKGTAALTVNEHREALGLPPREGPEGEILLIPSTYSTGEQLTSDDSEPPDNRGEM